MAQASYKHEPGTSFYIPAIGRTIMSPKYLPEMWKSPEEELSHRHSFADRFFGDITGMNIVIESRLHSDLVRVQLT